MLWLWKDWTFKEKMYSKEKQPNQTKDKRSNANQITVESSDSPRTTTGTIGVNKLASEAGVFIRVKVNGVNANMLIDTGATVNLISNDLFKKMENPLITTMNREFLSASGSSLH
jgi:predicted aspartyl protease